MESPSLIFEWVQDEGVFKATMTKPLERFVPHIVVTHKGFWPHVIEYRGPARLVMIDATHGPHYPTFDEAAKDIEQWILGRLL